MLFLKKLTWKFGKPLLLKSPPHTCRIKLLLGLFPDARFVHIHRNPCIVYQSTRHMLSRVLKITRLQNSSGYDAEGNVSRRYREMYDVFFEERGLIPEGRYCEVGFESLESNPIGTVRGVYERSACPTSVATRRTSKRTSTRSPVIGRTRSAELSPALRERITAEWRRCFDEWGYTP